MDWWRRWGWAVVLAFLVLGGGRLLWDVFLIFGGHPEMVEWLR